MTTETAADVRPANALLQSFSDEAYGVLAAGSERVLLPVEFPISHSGETPAYVYFPLTAVISNVTTMSDGATVETMTLGNEGMSGIVALAAGERASASSFVQVPGAAIRTETDCLRRLFESEPTVQRIMLAYMTVLLNVTGQSSACNRLHSVEQRAARWLLMTHDRTEGDTFSLSQQYLAQMLGVRRASVNSVSLALMERGAMRYRRAIVTVTDRKMLESIACECYGVIVAEYDKITNVTRGPQL